MNRRSFMMTTALAALSATQFSIGTAFAANEEMSETDGLFDLVIGNEDAPIEMIEYASYTCPHCATFHENVFKDLKKDYIDTGKVKFIYREVYFDKFGLWASMVARCGGEMRYFGIQNMLFEEQKDWIGSGKDTMAIVESLRKIGTRAGLSDEDLDACLNDGAMAEKLYEKFTKEVEEYEVNATPTLVIDGEKHSNMNYASLKEILDAKLEG